MWEQEELEESIGNMENDRSADLEDLGSSLERGVPLQNMEWILMDFDMVLLFAPMMSKCPPIHQVRTFFRPAKNKELELALVAIHVGATADVNCIKF